MKQAIIKSIALFVIQLMLYTPVSFALTLHNITVEPKGNSAVISWNTNVDANSRVDYGIFGFTKVKREDNMVKNHSIKITELEPETKYMYRIVSTSSNETVVAQGNFSTTDEIPPEPVKNLTAKAGRNEITITWDQVNISDFKKYIIYRDEEKLLEIETISVVSYTDSGLDEDTEYTYGVSLVDTSNNEGDVTTITVTTKAPDLAPPKIINLTVSALGDTTATISWQTDETASSRVHYGQTQSLGLVQTVQEIAKVHTVILTNLSNNTKYFYKAESCDASGNCINSSVKEFTTGADFSEIFLNVSLPRYWNNPIINIKGTTKSFSSVRLYKNDKLVRFVKTDIRGIFDFSKVRLTRGENTIVLQAKDNVGNELNKSFNILLDLLGPSLNVRIPTTSTSNSLTISGSVDENSTVEFFVLSKKDKTAPGIVKNIRNRSITKDSIILEWDSVDASDLKGYVIYRSDLGPIAIVAETVFEDKNIEASKSYIYQVAAIDDSCNIGPRSNELRLTAHANATTNATTKAISAINVPSCLEPQKKLETTANFSVDLSLEEGNNEIKITATDNAGNTETRKGTVFVDVRAPVIQEHNLNKITPTFVLDVTVSGRVSEQSTVFVYLNDESEPSFSGKTDSQGNFAIPISLDRDVTANVSVESQRPISNTNVNPPSNFGVRGSADSDTIFVNKITLIAVDSVGHKSSPVSGEIAFKICGRGGDWIIQQTDIFPKELVPRFMLMGIAQIGFTLNLSWAGAGEERRINNIRVIKRMDLSEEEKEKWDLDWVTVNNPGNSKLYNRLKASYVQLRVHATGVKGETLLEQEKQLAKHNTENCLLGIPCVRVPLMVEVDYDRPFAGYIPNSIAGSGNTSIRPVSERFTQKQCVDLEVAIQPRIPPDFIPKGLLEGIVGLLDGVIGGIDNILKFLEPATKFVLFGCLLSWVVLWFKKATEYGACTSLSIGGIDIGNVVTGFDFNECRCPNGECTYGDQDKGSEQSIQCQTCYDAKKSTLDFQQSMQFLCDRVFCPAVPSINKHAKDSGVYANVVAKVPFDKSVHIPNAQSERPSDCRNDGYNVVEGKYDKDYPGKDYCDASKLKPQGGYRQSCCEEEYQAKWKSAALGIDPLKRSKCLAEGKDVRECGGWGSIYESIASINTDLCRAEEQNEIFYSFPEGDFVVSLGEETKDPRTGKPKTVNPKAWTATVYRQGEVIKDAEREKALKESLKNNNILQTGAQATSNPYTSIQRGEARTIGEEGNLRMTRTVVTKGEVILEYDDTCRECFDVSKDEKERGKACSKCKCYQCQFYDKENEELIGNTKASKERCTYKRTVDGKTATLQIPNTVVNAVCQGGSGKDYVIDPTSGLLRSIQTGCLTAITSYLQQYREILNIIRNCFKSILVTGDGSAGVCRATLSVYVCDLIYYALRCVTQRPTSGFGGRAVGLGGFIGHLTRAGAEIQQGIANRYGSTNLFRVMFVERKLFNAACVSFFTGTSGIDWEGMIRQTVRVPVKSMVVVSPATRRFNSFNAITGTATHIYRIGLLIVAGSDLNYNVQLVCSNDNSCNPNEGFEGGLCDCAHGAGEITFPINQFFKSQGSSRSPGLQGSTLLARTGTNSMIAGDTLNNEAFIIVDQPGVGHVRYDKVRVTYTYIDNQNQLKTEVLERPITQEGGNAPNVCRFDGTEYTCRLFELGIGRAFFKEILKPRADRGDDRDLERYGPQEDPAAEITIRREEGPGVCLFIKVEDETGRVVSRKFYDITEVGETKRTYVMMSRQAGRLKGRMEIKKDRYEELGGDVIFVDKTTGTIVLTFEDVDGGGITFDENNKIDKLTFKGTTKTIAEWNPKNGRIELGEQGYRFYIDSVKLPEGKKEASFSIRLVANDVTSKEQKYKVEFQLRGLEKGEVDCTKTNVNDVIRFGNDDQIRTTRFIIEGTGDSEFATELQKKKIKPGEETKAVAVNVPGSSADIEFRMDVEDNKYIELDKKDGTIKALEPGRVNVYAYLLKGDRQGKSKSATLEIEKISCKVMSDGQTNVMEGFCSFKSCANNWKTMSSQDCENEYVCCV